MDMACGKGQDLFRYSQTHVENLVGLEIDTVAIQEFISRKHQFGQAGQSDHQGRGKNNPMNIKIVNMNLNDTNCSELLLAAKIKLPAEGFDTIVCNFAFHYFVKNLASLKNITKFIAAHLKEGGRFVMTCFDGAAIRKLLKNVNEWTTDIYSIRKTDKYSATNMIEVRLPFSRDAYYAEYLVDIEAVELEFVQHKIFIENDLSFSHYFNDYDKLDRLTEDDKKYVGLYHYYSFKKNSQKMSEGLARSMNYVESSD
jgi:SAM-dependent methyltransferase